MESHHRKTGLQDVGPLRMMDNFDRMSDKSNMRFNTQSRRQENLEAPTQRKNL